MCCGLLALGLIGVGTWLRGQGVVAQHPLVPLQEAFEHVPQILEQMPSIQDLDRLGQCPTNGSGVFSRAIATDHSDVGMLCQLGLHHGLGSVGQQIDGPMSFQINDHGAVGLATPEGKVIHADDAGSVVPW